MFNQRRLKLSATRSRINAYQRPAFGVEQLEQRLLLHGLPGGLEHGVHSTPEQLAFARSHSGLAATVQDFDDPGTPFFIGNFADPNGPVAVPGGPTGNYLHMADAAVFGDVNTIAFDRTAPGLYEEIVAEFDFRMDNGDGRADGIGFALLNTATFGNRGPVYGFEEANFTGSLGVGFDIYTNPEFGDIGLNNVSIHFNGNVLTEVDATPVVDLAGGEWIHAKILLRPGGGNSDVSVILTPPGGQPTALIDQFDVPGLEPYESRAFFSARTGGSTANHDIDNVNVEFTGEPDPAVYGLWSDVMEWDIIAIHAHLLPTGQVLAWERLGETRLWEPATGTLSPSAQPGFDSFCTGHAFLPDGRLLVLGGHIQDGVGLPNSATYNPVLNEWIAGPDMNAGRWYPTSTTLADGNVVVVSGSIDGTLGVNSIPQVWQTETSTWRTLTGADRALPLYPFMHIAPNGQVFNSGPNTDTAYLDTTGTGAWTNVANTASGIFRDYGSSVMYDDGKVLIVGGGPPTNTAEVIDLNAASPAWRLVPSMAYARRQLNATILPDGEVLVTGGTSASGFNNATGQVQVAEMWNPATETWSMLAGMQEARLYHSTALLLPDGRVLSAGGGAPAGGGADADHLNAEIYSPPYLFKGPRPTILVAPNQVAYGQPFNVRTNNAYSIRAVTLVRLSSVTHAFNQNQRFSRLSFAGAETELNVTAPGDRNLTPPGYYMMFIIDASGVPSVAKIIRIGDSSGPVVQDVQLYADRHGVGVKRIVLSFDRTLDATRAKNRQNYDLRLAGPDSQFGTGDDKIIRVRSRVYDPVLHTVTLTLSRRLVLRNSLQITAVGTGTRGVSDIFDNLLDGDGDGNPGGDFVTLFVPTT